MKRLWSVVGVAAVLAAVLFVVGCGGSEEDNFSKMKTTCATPDDMRGIGYSEEKIAFFMQYDKTAKGGDNSGCLNFVEHTKAEDAWNNPPVVGDRKSVV